MMVEVDIRQLMRMAGDPQFVARLEVAIGKVLLENSPSVMGTASNKAQHSANDLRMMFGYRTAVIREATRRLLKEYEEKGVDNALPPA